MKNKIIALVAVVAFLVTFSVAHASVLFNNNLRYGMTNSLDVQTLQTFLTNQGFYGGPISGNFFSLTEAGVMAFQAKNGLPTSGYFGPLSRSIANSLSTQSSSNTQPTIQQSYNQYIQTPQNTQNYTTITFPQYQNNPSSYISQGVVFTALVNGFIPSTGQFGSKSYMEVINPYDITQPKIELEVDDSVLYTNAVNTLSQKADPTKEFVRVYGTGALSQSFTENTLFGTKSVALPVLNVSRIDQCTTGTMNTTVLTGSTIDDNFTCSSWTTLGTSQVSAQPATNLPDLSSTGGITSLASALQNFATYSVTPFTTKGVVTGLSAGGTVNNVIWIQDPSNSGSAVTVNIDQTTYNKLKVGSVIETRGVLENKNPNPAIISNDMYLDMQGNPIQVISY